MWKNRPHKFLPLCYIFYSGGKIKGGLFSDSLFTHHAQIMFRNLFPDTPVTKCKHPPPFPRVFSVNKRGNKNPLKIYNERKSYKNQP